MDYIGFGPVFPTQTKENPDPVVGCAALARIVDQSGRPVVAIGGITRANLGDVVVSGARWVAAIGAIYEGLTASLKDDAVVLAERVRRWNHAFDRENR